MGQGPSTDPVTGADRNASEDQGGGFRIGRYFQARGIATADVPMALVYWKALNGLIWGGMLVAAYNFRPLQRLGRKPWARALRQRIQDRYPGQIARMEDKVMATATRFAEWKYFRPVPRFMGLNAKRLVLALAETVVLYKATMPVHVPFQFWAILYLMSSRAQRTTMAEMRGDVHRLAESSRSTHPIHLTHSES